MIRRFLTRILMVVLIGACGYNGWQVHQMRGEIARLRAQIASDHRPPGRAARYVAPDPPLDRANRHADRARLALGRGDFGTAQRELAQATADLRRAARAPEARTEGALTEARRTLTRLQSQADALARRAADVRRAIAR